MRTSSALALPPGRLIALSCILLGEVNLVTPKWAPGDTCFVLMDGPTGLWQTNLLINLYAVLLGRPPFAPLARAAAALLEEVDAPPLLASSRIHA